MTFKVVPKEGMAINMEGPWKLEIEAPEGTSLAKKTLEKADMDAKLPGFVVSGTLKGPIPKGGYVAPYKLIAFVCTADKTKCFREVHKGEVRW
jgi:hypothetical protein